MATRQETSQCPNTVVRFDGLYSNGFLWRAVQLSGM